MSEYIIKIEKIEDCPAYFGKAENGEGLCDWQEDEYCHGLGQPGCPFQPVQEESYETCKYERDCPKMLADYDHITHCSAYTKETQ